MSAVLLRKTFVVKCNIEVMKLNLHIAICDDEPILLNTLSMMVEEVMSKKKIPFEIDTFSSGEKLVEQVKAFQLVFLDIEMPNMDGIDTGGCILRWNPECKVVIASGRVDRFQETYKIKAFRFIVKPYEMEEIEEAIDAYLNQCIGMQKVELFYKRNPVWVQQRDISYVVAFGSYVEVVVRKQVYRKEISLFEMEQQFDQRCFFRIHRQYLVNMFWVTGYEKGKVFVSGEVLLLSRRKQKAFEQAYMEFDLIYR